MTPLRSIFLVQHLHVLEDDQEEYKIIGVYESREAALDAIQRVANQPGFRGWPKMIDPMEDDQENGFYISEYEIGKDHWTEGYVTVRTG